jgi:hypothetical protein
MAFSDCLRAALSEGLINQDDFERISALHERLSKEDPLNVLARVADEEKKRSANMRRSKLLQAKAQGAAWTDITRAARLRAERGQDPDLVASVYGLFENITSQGINSARQTYTGLLGAATVEMSELLHRFRRSAVTLKRFNRPLLDDVARAAFGANVSEEAKAFYGVFYKVADKLRTLYNEAGGRIDWREDWGLPQSHNAGALLGAGFEKWRDYILPRIDWTRTGEAFAMPISAADREGVLRHVYESVTQNNWNTRELESTVAFGKSYANRRADHRFLVFKDAEGWLEYSRAYGKGEPWEVMMAHVRSMSRDIAIMQRFGPNPHATVEWLKALVSREAAKHGAGEPSLFAGAPSMAESSAASALRTIDGYFEIARGLNAPRSPVGDAVKIYTNGLYGALMGSSVVTDLAVNPIVQKQMRHLHGIPMSGVVRDTLGALATIRDKREALQSGVILDDMLHTMERGAREEGALAQARDFSNWLPKITTHFSGLDALAYAQRQSAYNAMMAQTANMLDREWSAIEPRFLDTLKGYGITADDWAVMRQATPHEPRPGAPFLRPQDIAAIGPDAHDIAVKYNGMLHMVMESLQPTSNWRVGAYAAAHGFRDPARPTGMLYRSMETFRGGWLATYMITQWSAAMRENARNGTPMTLAKYLAVFVPAMMLAGTASYQLRQLAVGKDLAPMDPTTHEGRVTYAKGFLTSGGLPVFADFLTAQSSAYGHGFASTVTGPLFQAGETAANTALAPVFTAYDLAFGRPGGEKRASKAADRGVRMLRNNTPLLTTHWALRAAWNRLILDQLQFMADPEAHSRFRRQQDKLRRETGQRFYWPPGAPTPERAPQLTPGGGG